MSARGGSDRVKKAVWSKGVERKCPSREGEKERSRVWYTVVERLAVVPLRPKLLEKEGIFTGWNTNAWLVELKRW